MTVLVPQYLQDKGYPAQYDRQLLADLLSPGVVVSSAGTNLLVTSGGTARTVSIAKGGCYIAGTQVADQGLYRLFNDAPIILTHATAVTFPRLDQIIARVIDATVTGSGVDAYTLEILQGVETSGATLVNRSGAIPDGSLPANSLRVADILVPVGAGSVIPSGNINDRRTYAVAVGSLPIGAEIPYTGLGDVPGGLWVVTDGRLLDRWTYNQFYQTSLHIYNGGVDPGGNKVRIPEKRGRVSVGAINMGTGDGFAIGSDIRASVSRGGTGGETNHILVATEMPVHDHGAATGTGTTGAGTSGGNASLDHSHLEHIGGGGPTDGVPVVASSVTVAAISTGGVNGGNPGLNHTHSVPGLSVPGLSIAPNGGGVKHNNLQPYEGDSWLVRIA